MKCTCLEILGEDPNCAAHGVGTDYWAQGIVDGPLERSGAVGKIRLHYELVFALEYARDLLQMTMYKNCRQIDVALRKAKEL